MNWTKLGHWVRTALPPAGRGVLAILAAFSLGAAVYLGLNDKVAGGTLCGALGLLVLAFVQLSRFKKFKGLGFEAELWEEKQKEAAALIDQTKALLGALTSSYMTTVPRLGRWDVHYTRRELYDLAANLERLLKEAGVPASAIEVQGEVRRIIAGDLARPVARSLGELIAQRFENAKKELTARYGSPIRDSAGFHAEWTALTARHTGRPDYKLLAKASAKELPGLLRGWLAEAGLLTDDERAAFLDEHADAFADLEAWAHDGSVRRPDVFFRQDADG